MKKSIIPARILKTLSRLLKKTFLKITELHILIRLVKKLNRAGYRLTVSFLGRATAAGLSVFFLSQSKASGQNIYVIDSNNPFQDVNFVSNTKPYLFDDDNDGDLDLVIGKGDGKIEFYRNEGTSTNFNFVKKEGADNPFNNINNNHHPSIVNRVITNHPDNNILSITQPNNNLQNPSTVPLGIAYKTSGQYVATHSSYENIVNSTFLYAYCGNITSHEGLEMILGDAQGKIHLYTRKSGMPFFIAEKRTDSENPLSHVNVESNASPVIFDADGDGDNDVFVGAGDGKIYYYKNTGSINSPDFQENQAENPFSLIDLGENAAITFGDLDGDGIVEAIAGNADGQLFLLRKAVVSGTDNNNSTGLSIYPNPAVNLIKIKTENRTDEIEYTIIDNQGREVLRNKARGVDEITIDTSKLPEGNYSLIYKNGNQIFSGKFSKIKN
ncbi:MAG: T9SS type A sorting domain-containing protein [Cytophagaceae bacterium]